MAPAIPRQQNLTRRRTIYLQRPLLIAEQKPGMERSAMTGWCGEHVFDVPIPSLHCAPFRAVMTIQIPTKNRHTPNFFTSFSETQTELCSAIGFHDIMET
jgi:hypothetical protein